MDGKCEENGRGRDCKMSHYEAATKVHCSEILNIMEISTG